MAASAPPPEDAGRPGPGGAGPHGAAPPAAGPGEPIAAAAAAVLVANHRQFLSFLERRVGSRAVAEDILQDAFVRGMGKLDSLRDGESAMAWFYRLLRNAVVDHHRRRGANERKLSAFEAELESLDPRSEVHGAVCGCVRELAATLKPEYAEALQAVEVAGVPVKDYAAQIGVSASNAGVRVFRARRALLEQVERCCGSCAEHGCLDCTCGTATAPHGHSRPAP